MHKGITTILTVFLSLSLLIAPNIFAQEQQKQEGKSSGENAGQMGENLAQQARNPTAALTQMQIVVNHNPSFHNLDDADQTSFVLMPVIPFKTGKLQHIARIVLPYVAAGPDWGALAEEEQGNTAPPNYVPTKDKTGLGDSSLFDLLIFPAPWKGGKIAAGLSTILPTATDPALGTEKWSLGPAFGALVQSGKLLAGGIFTSNFSVAGKSDRDDVCMMTLQPFGSYGLGKGWSVEASEMVYNYDFNTKRWSTLPLGVRLGKLVSFGKHPVRFYADVEYNFADNVVAPAWTLRSAVVPLL